jgi:hypothetical protein
VTVGRLEAGRRRATVQELTKLAELVRPRDAALADKLLVAAGVAPQRPPAASAQADARGLPRSHVVDGVLCAAAEAADLSPKAMRRALLAAFERAQTVGLSVAEVIAGLRAGGG